MNTKTAAKKGRGSDRVIGHLTPGEITIPPQLQTPELKAAILKAFANSGKNLSEFTVASGANKVNPKTGLREFDAGDGMGAGDPGQGGLGDPGSIGGGEGSATGGGTGTGGNAAGAMGVPGGVQAGTVGGVTGVGPNAAGAMGVPGGVAPGPPGSQAPADSMDAMGNIGGHGFGQAPMSQALGLPNSVVTGIMGALFGLGNTLGVSPPGIVGGLASALGAPPGPNAGPDPGAVASGQAAVGPAGVAGAGGIDDASLALLLQLLGAGGGIPSGILPGIA